jgi:dihydroorotate dehydrogenase
MNFKTPVGLAAGFDYEARLTQILYTLGFSFQSIGTITRQPCAGNAKPRLGRLPLSKSLLVNKGFRNPGAKAVIRKLTGLNFYNPVGVSLGQTNTNRVYTRASVMADILGSFQLFEKSSVAHQYYELNISCPNLKTAFNFYNPKNLDYLLSGIDALELTRPIFVKMPISEPDAVILELLKVISKHSPVGVIIGNLHKDRLDSAIVPSERQGLGPGNLSGKATFNRSNHLIALTYRHFHSKLLIIGCGGVFTPADAYLKIQLGASLIQLITGMIFQGPQLVAQVNYGLAELVAADGYQSISQAIGKKNKAYLK